MCGIQAGCPPLDQYWHCHVLPLFVVLWCVWDFDLIKLCFIFWRKQAHSFFENRPHEKYIHLLIFCECRYFHFASNLLVFSGVPQGWNLCPHLYVLWNFGRTGCGFPGADSIPFVDGAQGLGSGNERMRTFTLKTIARVLDSMWSLVELFFWC